MKIRTEKAVRPSFAYKVMFALYFIPISYMPMFSNKAAKPVCETDRE